MPSQLSKHEYNSILSEPKSINGDIVWTRRADSLSVNRFSAPLVSEWPLLVHANFNPDVPTLSYLIVHKRHGRILGLDLGKEHHNPQCHMVGEKHLHEWNEDHRDKVARIPEEITAGISHPVGVWQQFCELTNIIHKGELQSPPPRQEELFP